MRTEYALNVKKKGGGFLYQVDCFETQNKAEREAQTLLLNGNEEYDIVKIIYDDNENEISALSIL